MFNQPKNQNILGLAKMKKPQTSFICSKKTLRATAPKTAARKTHLDQTQKAQTSFSSGPVKRQSENDTKMYTDKAINRHTVKNRPYSVPKAMFGHSESGYPENKSVSYLPSLPERASDEGGIRHLQSLIDGFEYDRDVLAWLTWMMAESPTGRALYQVAKESGWQLCFEDLQDGCYILDVSKKRLILDHFGLKPSALGRSVFFRHTMLAAFCRALRDIWHEETYTDALDTLAPDHVLIWERVRAADTDTVALLMGWELRASGYGALWRHMMGSVTGDMAMIYAQMMDRAPRSQFDGTALAYAFRNWYGDEERVDGCDHMVLELMDERLQETKLEVSRGKQPKDTFGQNRIDPVMLESLSLLPDGTRYLAGLGATIMQDPFFAGLKDPINQAHFYQILHDQEAVRINEVPFRDRKLARQIFPDAFDKADGLLQ